MTFEDFRKASFHGRYVHMRFTFLARMGDEPAADAVAAVLDRLGEALDTGDLAPVRQAVHEARIAAYTEDSSPTVDDAPFTALPAELSGLRLALLSAGGPETHRDV